MYVYTRSPAPPARYAANVIYMYIHVYIYVCVCVYTYVYVDRSL